MSIHTQSHANMNHILSSIRETIEHDLVEKHVDSKVSETRKENKPPVFLSAEKKSDSIVKISQNVQMHSEKKKEVPVSEREKIQPAYGSTFHTPAAVVGSADILDLTQWVREDGAIIDLGKQKEVLGKTASFVSSTPQGEKENQNVQDSQSPPPRETINKSGESTDLISSKTFEESSKALKELTTALENSFSASPRSSSLHPGDVGALTAEQLMRELLRPMLKEWLDAYLPSLVKWLVAEQIEKMVHQGMSAPSSCTSLSSKEGSEIGSS